MIDIHCHILPEVDDGACDLEESLAMARLAVGCGVSDIIATPHFTGVPEALEGVEHIHRQYRLLQSALKRERIPLQLHLGVEVLCLPQTLELAREKQLPTLGNSNYVLTEFYFDASWAFMDATLEGLRELGYRPVVAHPERYGAVQRDIHLAQSWFDRGFVLQVNKGSVLGAFGRRAEDTAVRMLYRGIAHMLASDAHTSQVRTTDLEPARRWCIEHVGRGYTKILLEDNPKRLLRGRPMCEASRRE